MERNPCDSWKAADSISWSLRRLSSYEAMSPPIQPPMHGFNTPALNINSWLMGNFLSPVQSMQGLNGFLYWLWFLAGRAQGPGPRVVWVATIANEETCAWRTRPYPIHHPWDADAIACPPISMSVMSSITIKPDNGLGFRGWEFQKDRQQKTRAHTYHSFHSLFHSNLLPTPAREEKGRKGWWGFMYFIQNSTFSIGRLKLSVHL